MPNIPEELLSPYYLELDYPFIQGGDGFWQRGRILAGRASSPLP